MVPLMEVRGTALPCLESLLDGVTDGVLVLDRQGRPTYVNPEAEHLLGRARQALLGQCLWAEGLEAQTALGRACQRALGEGVPSTGEEYRARQGVWVEARVFPSAEGLLVLLRDISTSKQVEAETLRQMERALEERDRARGDCRAKDTFLAVLSHELRTPLTSILGWTSLLRTGHLPEEQRECALETVERSARVQLRLVEDLLDSARIIAGKMRLEPRPVEFLGVVRAALDMVRPSVGAHEVRFESALEPGTGLVLGDAQRLQQVVSNLLTNALKFTPSGGRVTVRLRREGTQGVLEVEDSGRGISPDFLPRLFERFQQADGGSLRRTGGLGLGLSIVRHLVELHGGEVQAQSEGVGRGARFTVRLPLLTGCADGARSPETTGGRPRQQGHPPGPSTLHVLGGTKPGR